MLQYIRYIFHKNSTYIGYTLDIQDTHFLWNPPSRQVYLVSKQGKGGVMLGNEKEMRRCKKQEIHFEM